MGHCVSNISSNLRPCSNIQSSNSRSLCFPPSTSFFRLVASLRNAANIFSARSSRTLFSLLFLLYGAIEAIILPMMLSLESEIRHWQENEPQNPLIELMPEYFNHPALVLYTARKLDEYHAADLSLLPLAVYYLKTVYNEKTYFQTCKRCGKLFRANTANIASFCSDECKKAQKRDNKRRFDEKAKDMPCERAYKTQYMFWYNRMTKLLWKPIMNAPKKSTPATLILPPAAASTTFTLYNRKHPTCGKQAAALRRRAVKPARTASVLWTRSLLPAPSFSR
jgi:hypothetical protein